ncbi:hypothetical protein ASAP_0826 [Asaia bogorensis]|uniref:Uncharacterized protein n=1 Tax=Asaia bogorensis TaxID=91915 RepID=A0A060QI00_9PROT|nr:hypothetical protein ASAP_0826 [Asaia bogorensis]
MTPNGRAMIFGEDQRDSIRDWNEGVSHSNAMEHCFIERSV